MGNLVPEANYIYERNGHVVYARKAGENKRVIIGYDYKSSNFIDDADMWRDMNKVANTTPALRNALDYAIMIYKLAKEDFDDDQ